MTLRNRGVILAIVGGGAVVLAAVMTARDDGAAAARPGGGGRARTQQSRSGEVSLNDVKLELLQRTPVALEEPGRNPFRFEPRPAPAAAQSAGQPRATTPTVPQNTAPTGPAPPPPIPLKFIGLVEAPSQAGRIAILSDGKGNVFYGKEGDTIEGRYRMLKVSLEVVELAFLDGRGRQTIRLSGQ